MPTAKTKIETLRRRAAQARADAIRRESIAAIAERGALDAAARLAALRYPETPLLYKRAEEVAWIAATNARACKRRATAAKRRATLAAERLAEREREERERLAYRARAIAAGILPLPEEEEERAALADAAEALLADPGAMLGGGDRNALAALLSALGRFDPGED